MVYTDMHIHALFGVDDGPKTKKKMLDMIDISYHDGIRFICLTPHFYPRYYGDNHCTVLKNFKSLKNEADARWPEIRLGIGNELRYEQGCVTWLKEGICQTMNGTGYVLVDFYDEEENYTIKQGLYQLLNAGYTPVLAHAERYRRLHKCDVEEVRGNGVLIQVDAQSLLCGFGFLIQQRCKTLLKARLVDFAGSDAHDTSRRPPGISCFFEAVGKFCGTEYAAALCKENAEKLFYKMSIEN